MGLWEMDFTTHAGNRLFLLCPPKKKKIQFNRALLTSKRLEEVDSSRNQMGFGHDPQEMRVERSIRKPEPKGQEGGMLCLGFFTVPSFMEYLSRVTQREMM